MIFNFTSKHQFTKRLSLGHKTIDQTNETKLLGLVLRDDLSWKSNTEFITISAHTRMLILRNLFPFDVPTQDLIDIYILYIRSVVDHSAVVWHSSLTKGEQKDLERVQKVALKIILKDSYTSYEDALKVTGLNTLTARRTKLCLNFSKKCIKNDKTSHMFPENDCRVTLRNPEPFFVTSATTERLAKSAIPYMQRLLNTNYKKQE